MSDVILGNCFEVAAQMVVDFFGEDCPELAGLSDIRLAHGIVCGQGPLEGYRFTHAWVEGVSEKGIPMVVDCSNGREVVMPQGLYYLIGGIDEEEVQRYTDDQARERLIERATYGPWDGAPAKHVDPKPSEVEGYESYCRSVA
jgi:hypothetical protein